MSECNSVECNSIETTHCQRKRDVILNRAKKYYENNKKVLKDKTRGIYRDLLQYGKRIRKKRKHKEKLKEYQKNYLKVKKS